VRGRRIVFAVTVAALTLSGCAIPTQRTPSAIPSSHVPGGLLDHQLPTTTTTQPKPSVQVKIYLLNPGHRLVPQDRVVQIPAALKSVVISLLGGPSRSEESAKGITTAIPSNVRVLFATESKNPPLVTVDFNEAFGQITGSSTELAVAQVVFTVVTQSGLLGTGVIFEIDGQTISVPVASGAQVSGPVYLSQFLPNAAS
jgi:Sporulation and spore germination